MPIEKTRNNQRRWKRTRDETRTIVRKTDCAEHTQMKEVIGESAYKASHVQIERNRHWASRNSTSMHLAVDSSFHCERFWIFPNTNR
jgi:hypothetical protein